jgi:hypothetical protein
MGGAAEQRTEQCGRADLDSLYASRGNGRKQTSRHCSRLVSRTGPSRDVRPDPLSCRIARARVASITRRFTLPRQSGPPGPESSWPVKSDCQQELARQLLRESSRRDSCLLPGVSSKLGSGSEDAGLARLSCRGEARCLPAVTRLARATRLARVAAAAPDGPLTSPRRAASQVYPGLSGPAGSPPGESPRPAALARRRRSDEVRSPDHRA